MGLLVPRGKMRLDDRHFRAEGGRFADEGDGRMVWTVTRLLAPGDPPPFTTFDGNGESPFLVVCDHAGRCLPQRLGTLGLSEEDLDRHIAWDIGAGAVAYRVGEALGAYVVGQTYSRLVIDCNRPLGSPSSIIEVSERTRIPGNMGLTEVDKEARAREIFEPYHRHIESELHRRRAENEPTVLIAMHSFTPRYLSVERPWHVGLLYRHVAFARGLFDLLRAEDLLVGDNEPYRVSDATDYTIPVHGERHHLLHVGIEIRQDLIAGEVGQRRWAALLARLLPIAYERLVADSPPSAP
jgi:predicted N-formylglutamate amidohydrolase